MWPRLKDVVPIARVLSVTRGEGVVAIVGGCYDNIYIVLSVAIGEGFVVIVEWM